MSTPSARPDKSEAYAQACRDAAYLFQHLKGLPWAEGRVVKLKALENAANSLLTMIQALLEAERLGDAE